MARKELYPAVESGQWVQPIRKGYRTMCCDCGLIHIFNFRVRKGKIQFQAFRDQRATGQIRRYRGVDKGEVSDG